MEIRKVLTDRVLKAMMLLMLVFAGVDVHAKEFTTTLARDVTVTYLVNTTDKIARVKKVEEGVNPPQTVTVPKTVKYTEGSKSYTLTVVGIGEGAFASTWFETIILPSTIKTIGKEAFLRASVRKCALPAKLEKIGESAFQNSYLSGTLTIPAGCSSIGKFAFTGTRISAIDLDDDGSYVPLYIDDYAFSVSSVQTAEIKRASHIGEGIFSMCDELKVLNISGSLNAVPRTMCYGCESLERIGLPVIESIGEMAFCNCTSLRDFPFMPGLKTIGGSAFEHSGLTAVRLKAGCESIGESGFFDCSNLTTVEFPASMKSVGQAAFQRCFILNSVTCDAVNPPAMKDASFQKYTGVTVWVPVNSVPAYERAEGWRCFNYDHLTGAVEGIPTDEEAVEVRRYDLQGNPVTEGREPRGVYIEVRGGKGRLVRH